MQKRNNRVGGEVDSYCGKCKEETRHVVIAMVEDAPKRVECLSCHAVHNYRPRGSVSTPRRASRAATPRVRKEAGLTEVLDAKNAVDYRPNGKFENGVVVKHKTFGLGKVVNMGTQVMTVAFSDKLRKLFLTP
ncbi:MAG: hypothetical protein P9L99_08055 [Candidatus Lernaella stagnicola]|nr:hypothetical protein [Candidatus Lernaella stagnicola]